MSRWNAPRLDAAALWEYAVRALAGRAHSSGELRAKLERKAQKKSDVEATLARLKEYKYLDDRKYAESFATARLEHQQFGKNRVLRDLRQRRIAPAVAEGTVSKVYQETDEAALIENFMRRHFRSVSRERLFQNEKELAAAYRKLWRAGFSSGNIVGVLKRFAREPELLDRFEPPPPMEEEEA